MTYIANGLPLRVSEGAQRDAFQGLKTNFNLPRAQKRSYSITDLIEAGKLTTFIATSNSGRVYPHRYDADDASRSPEVQAKLNKFGECMTGFGTDGRTFLEFPVKYAVVGTGNVYTGGDPGAVHVIAVRIPAANGRPALYHYCLTVTHERWGSPHFVPCR